MLGEDTIKKEFEYFEQLIIKWFQGDKTSTEIINETKNIINISLYLNQGYSFDYAFRSALEEYDSTYPFNLDFYMSEGILLPTIKGLVHHLNELNSENISIDIFLDWASWCNIGCENTSGEFENLNIEYFCLIFILKYKDCLKSKDFINQVIAIVKNSNFLSYGEFIIKIYLLIDTEYKSFYYFFKSYLENKKTDSDLNQYLIKKYNYNLSSFKYDIEVFPYYDKLVEMKNKTCSVEEFIDMIKHNNNEETNNLP